MSLGHHAILLTVSLTSALLWPFAGFVCTWLCVWGLVLCDRRVKTATGAIRGVRRYQVSLWLGFWASLAWTGTMS